MFNASFWKAAASSEALIVFFWRRLAGSGSSRPLRPVTMQPRQSARYRRASRRVPGKPADGEAVRTGCENGAPRCVHRFTFTVLPTVALCANSQEGSAPTGRAVRADRLIIATHVVAVRRCSLARGLQVPATLDDVMIYRGATRYCGCRSCGN